MSFIQHCFICRPSDSTVSEDAGIEQYTMPFNVLSSRTTQDLRFKNPRKACCEEWTYSGRVSFELWWGSETPLDPLTHPFSWIIITIFGCLIYCLLTVLHPSSPPCTSCKNLPRPSFFSIFRGIEGIWGVRDGFVLGAADKMSPLLSCPELVHNLVFSTLPLPPFWRTLCMYPAVPAAPPCEGAPAPSSSPQERGESWELTLLLPRSYSWVWSLRKKLLQVGAREVGKQRKRK